MRNGSVYQRKDKRWCAQYVDADGRNRYLYRVTKREAKQALREALKDRDDGISPSKLTVNDVLTQWLQESKTEVSARTLDNREYLIRVHFSPHPIASTKLANLNQDQIRSYLDSKRKLAPSTRNKLLAILNHVGAEGVRFRVLRHNPTDGIKSVREDRELEILSANQIKHLLATVRGHKYELVVVLGATCGLRIGEALDATWEDVNVDRGTIEIKRTLWRGKLYSPKTKNSRRKLNAPNKTRWRVR